MKDEKQPLHVKYRPKTWDEVVGNEGTVKQLKAVLSEGTVRTFLLHGPTGTGKTTISRIIKAELGCSDIDYQEINTADNRGIDTIREIIQDCRFQPLQGNTRVILLDEAHEITGAASDALLKVVEDSPLGTYFIFATTNPEKLSATLKGRCSIYKLKLLTRDELLTLLLRVIEKEGKNAANLTEDVILKIIDAAEGCPREALKVLGQVMVLDNESEMINAILNFTITGDEFGFLARALMYNTWKEVLEILRPLDDEPEKVRRSILTYMMKVILSNNSDKDVKKAVKIMENFLESFFYTGKSGLILASWRCFNVNKI